MATPKPLHGAVVVITGASSGIGRMTAVAFARQGAAVVLAARREWALREIAESCERLGVPALVVPTDTTDEDAVQALARTAIERFGGIDVWVNNAGVGLYGRFEDTPAADFRRVIETNFFGYVHGARAVLPQFYRQGRGVLINNASIMGRVPGPYVSGYAASKHAVRAFGESLRQEALLAGAHDIHVCTVLPATIDTPFFRHVGNYTGRAVKAMPPVYAPQMVAEAIVGLAAHPQREVVVGAAGRMMELGMAASQGASEKALAVMVDRQHLANAPSPPTSGNLFRPMDAGSTISDGWDGLPGRGGQSPASKLVAAAALAAVPVALAWLNRKPGTTTNGHANGHAAAHQTNGSNGTMTKQELLIAWLNDALAMENALVQVLEHRIADAKDYPWVAERDRQHLEETRRHAELVRARLDDLGAAPSAVKSVLGTVFGAMQAPMTGVARDEIVKNFLVDHAAEQFEVASYQALIAAAEEVGDAETAAVCRGILAEDEAMAAWLVANLPRIVQERMREMAGTGAA